MHVTGPRSDQPGSAQETLLPQTRDDSKYYQGDDLDSLAGRASTELTATRLKQQLPRFRILPCHGPQICVTACPFVTVTRTYHGHSDVEFFLHGCAPTQAATLAWFAGE